MKKYIGGKKRSQNIPTCECGAELVKGGGYGIGFTTDVIPYKTKEEVSRAGGIHYICPSRGEERHDSRIHASEYIIMPDGMQYKYWKGWRPR
jgi:hypothetical protein